MRRIVWQGTVVVLSLGLGGAAGDRREHQTAVAIEAATAPTVAAATTCAAATPATVAATSPGPAVTSP
jgi:hypothetical protein